MKKVKLSEYERTICNSLSNFIVDGDKKTTSTSSTENGTRKQETEKKKEALSD